jgi:hypothetical protein
MLKSLLEGAAISADRDSTLNQLLKTKLKPHHIHQFELLSDKFRWIKKPLQQRTCKCLFLSFLRNEDILAGYFAYCCLQQCENKFSDHIEILYCYVMTLIHYFPLQVAMAFLTSNCKPLFRSSRQARVCTKIHMGLFDGMFGSKEKTKDDVLDRNFQVSFFTLITFAVVPEL